jgi:hypothetical protein
MKDLFESGFGHEDRIAPPERNTGALGIVSCGWVGWDGICDTPFQYHLASFEQFVRLAVHIEQ